MKKLEKTILNFTHDVKGVGIIKTTCKTFGNPITKGDTLDLASMCAKCKQTEDVVRACLVKAGKIDLKPKKVGKGGKAGVRDTPKESPYTIVVLGLSKDKGKEAILKRMVDCGVSASNAKNKYSSVSCCYKALTGNSRSEGSIAKYAAWILGGRKGDAPPIDAGSKSYTEKTYAVMKQYGVIA